MGRKVFVAQRLLQLDDITKSFGGARALRSVRFDLQAGEVHALIGENSAGKSTLIKGITGAHAPDSGTSHFLGQPISQLDPAQVRSLEMSDCMAIMHAGTIVGEPARNQVTQENMLGRHRATSAATLVVAAPILVAAVGMTLVILTRHIDISIGAQFSIAASREVL